MNFQAIENKKTYKQIIEQVLALIISGDLKSGNKLQGERTLAEMLSTSRPSIREAFRTLEIIGILEVRQGGGTYVRSFHIAPFINTIAPLFLKDIDVMGDMMDFRMLLEGEAVKAAALFSDQNTIDKMARALEDMKNDNTQTAEQADIDFHMSIFSATGNKAFALPSAEPASNQTSGCVSFQWYWIVLGALFIGAVVIVSIKINNKNKK